MLVTIGTNIVLTIRTGMLLCLSPPWRPLCVIGRLGTKKKKALMAQWKGERKKARLLPFPSSHRPLSAFYCLIIGIPSGNLCRGKSCCVPTLYMCNDRNVMVNSKPGDSTYWSGEDIFQVAWKKKLFIIQFMVFSSELGHCVPSLQVKFLVRKSNVPSLKNFSYCF